MSQSTHPLPLTPQVIRFAGTAESKRLQQLYAITSRFTKQLQDELTKSNPPLPPITKATKWQHGFRQRADKVLSMESICQHMLMPMMLGREVNLAEMLVPFATPLRENPVDTPSSNRSDPSSSFASAVSHQRQPRRNHEQENGSGVDNRIGHVGRSDSGRHLESVQEEDVERGRSAVAHAEKDLGLDFEDTDAPDFDKDETFNSDEYDLPEPQAVDLLGHEDLEYITPTPRGPLRSRQTVSLSVKSRAQVSAKRKTTPSSTTSSSRPVSGSDPTPRSRSEPHCNTSESSAPPRFAGPPTPASTRSPSQGPPASIHPTPIRSIESATGEDGSDSTEASHKETAQAKRRAANIRSKEYNSRKQGFTGLSVELAKKYREQREVWEEGSLEGAEARDWVHTLSDDEARQALAWFHDILEAFSQEVEALESTKKKAGRKRGRATRDDDDDTQSPESVAKSARHR